MATDVPLSPATPLPRQRAAAALQVGSIALPLLKCLTCPACLLLFGGIAAGAALPALDDERLHIALTLTAIAVDLALFQLSRSGRDSRAPELLLAAGATLALAGMFAGELVELAGLGVMMAAAVVNLILVRRSSRTRAACCDRARPPGA